MNTPFLPTDAAPTEAEINDEALIHACASGDESALQLLFRRHSAFVHTIALRVVNSASDADDILQDVMLEIWNQADRFKENKGSALAWISTLARRRAIDRLRRKHAYLRARTRYQNEAGVEADLFAPQSADGNAIESDRTVALQRLVRTLPPAQQQAVELAFYQGLSQRQISARTGIPLGTIKTRMELALKKIRAAVYARNGTVVEWAYTRVA